jgi:hypothetical protein
MSNGRSVDSTCNTSLSPNRTLLDGWGGARAVPRERAQRDRNKAMHITLGEVSSNLKPAAVEVLRVLVDGCFPDKVRRAGASLILRVDYLSVGSIAKRAHWCSIDERDEARHLSLLPITIEAFNDAMACVAGDRDAKIPPVTDPAAIAAAVAGALNLDLSAAAAVATAIVERRSLLAAKRRVDRALGQLVTSGIITRTRRAGGRSITLIELRAPFDIEEPGSTPPPGDSTDALAPGDSTDKPAAQNDANVVSGATETSHRSRQERRTVRDGNVVTGATKTSHPLLSLPAPEVPSCKSLLPPEPTGGQRMGIRGSLIRLGIESGAAQSVSLHPNVTVALVRSTLAAVKADKNVRSQAAVVLTRLRRELDMSEGPTPTIEQEPDEEPIEQPDEERAAVVALLTTDAHACTKATRGFIAAGGAEPDASSMSEQFVDWALDATREIGKLPSIVAWYRRRMGGTR